MQLMLVLLLLGGMLPAAAVQRKAWSESDGVYYLPTTDSQVETYTVDGTITFRGAAGKVPTWKDNGVVFAPKNAGEVISVTVNSNTLNDDAYLLVYDGAKSGFGEYNASDGKDQSKFQPAGWVKKWATGSAGETYTSLSSDGKLTFGYHNWTNGTDQNFDITVKSMKLTDMVFSSASALTGLSHVNRGAKNQAIFGVKVSTDGGLNPLAANLTIDCSALNGNTQVENVRLYKGKAYDADHLLATAATVGSNLTVTSDTLVSGDNYYMVVADITGDATGTIPALKVSELTVGGKACTVSPAEGDGVTIDNVILMPSTATTYVIGDDGALFYDDGGKDGKISLNFTGTVTFVPATAGKAIKIDFSKLAIFNTSSIGKNDILKFYNGRTADEDQLITTLLKDAEIVKSTAADGSMTVTLTSTTGVPADGWEATVSQFTPGPMTLSGVNAEPVSNTTTAAAGDKNVKMFTVDVQTDNQANPLKLSGLKFSTTDASKMQAIHVYALGQKNEYKTDSLFAEGTISGTDITLTGDATLKEGHNYLAVTIDLNNDGDNGDVVPLNINSVTVAGAEQPITAANAAMVTINNVCHLTQGAHSHVIKGEWVFTDTKSPYSPSKYEYENATYQVTFTPAEAGYAAQIDFSKFDVYYSSSSYYGVQAVFEIYSGSTPNADNLLWKLSSNADASKGPGKVLRSLAGDGSLTIVFNPKTTSSYYAGTGWEAIVKPYKNHDMAVDEINCQATETGDLATGATDASLIDFDVVTEGSLTSINLSKIGLKIAGSKALSRVKVLYSGNKDKAEDTSVYGTAEVTGDDVVVTGNQPLAEGSNHFWVLADVKADAEPETVVDVTLSALNDSTLKINPSGSRTVKAIVFMQPDTNVVTVFHPIQFYDDGGPNGDVTKSFKGVTIFKPGVAGDVVEMNTNAFTVGNGKFYLYNGSKVDEANLIGTYNYTTGPGQVISSAEDGALTVKFEGSASSYSSYKGFDITVSLHTPTAHVVDTVLSEPVTTAAVLRNEVNAQLLHATVKVSGDKGDVKLTGFKATLAGTTALADVKAVRLYYTGTAAGFNDKQLLAEVLNPAQNELTFTPAEAVTLSDKGSYHLWLTADVAADATAGNQVSLALTGVTVDSAEVAPIGTAAVRAIKAGMKGNYIIGASSKATYSTFAAATEALKGGVEGPVTFEVEDGTYAENVALQAVPGAGPNSPISFIGQSRDRSKVTITGAGYKAPDYGGFKQGMFLIDSTSYVTLKHMSFIPTDQTYPAAVHIHNSSRHVTLDSILVEATPVTTGYSGIALVRTEAVDKDGQNNDFFTVTNSSFTGGYIALYLGGTTYIALTRERGLTVKNNTVAESGSKAIYVTDEDDALIEGNTLTQSTTEKTGYWGIDLFRNRGNLRVLGNKIVNSTSYYSGGIQLRQTSRGTEQQPALVANNAISISNSPSASTAGIEVDGDQSWVSVLYNTVNISGNGGYAYYTARARSNASYKGIVVANNLLQANTTAGSTMFIYADYQALAQLSHNAYYSTDSTVVNGGAKLAGDTTSIFEKAEFIGASDLHLKQAGNLNMGVPSALVTTDIEGTARDAEHPTVGAYEFKEVTADKPAITEGYPIVTEVTETSATVKTKWNVSGKLYSAIEKVSAAAPAPRKAVAAADLLKGTPADYTAGAEQSTKFALEPASKYVASFLLVSAVDSTLQSDVVTTDTIITPEHIDDLELELETTSGTINAGESLKLEPMYAGGKLPYTYEWRNQMNEVVGTDSVLTVSPDHSQAYRFTITSADGQTASARTGVIVRGSQWVATFDDNYLAENSHWAYENASDVFYSGSFAFNGGNMPEYNYWWGYALSNSTSSAYSSLSDQYNAATGGGHKSSNFSVVYPQGTSIDVTNSADGDTISGFYISNNAYAYNSMTVGDSYAKKFTFGSYLKVVITGTAADGSTKSLDYYLGDYRASKDADHYILDTWQWVDLRPLGKVTKLTFTMDGSDKGKYGLNTPAYFIMDDLGGQPDMTEASRSVKANGGTIDLSELFTLNDSSTVTYSMESVGDTADVDLTLAADGTLTAGSGVNGAQRVVIVTATQQGKKQFVRLTVTLSEATAVTDAEVSAGVKLWPVPVTDRLNVATAMADYSVQVFSATGACVHSSNGHNGTAVIARDGWAPGLYVVRVSSNEGTATRRVIVK